MKKSYDQPRQHILKQRQYFANKGLSNQSYGFSSCHLWMWELDNKESWALKNWCFWTVVLEKTLESPLEYKEIQLVNPKGIQCWMFIQRLMLKLKLQSLATWCKEVTRWKRPWCWVWLKVGGEVVDRGQDGWMASPTWWTWVWVCSRNWWGTEKPGVLYSMVLQRVGQTEWLNCTELNL